MLENANYSIGGLKTLSGLAKLSNTRHRLGNSTQENVSGKLQVIHGVLRKYSEYKALKKTY